ncbi:MAG: transglycosylase SLT domain-containing protein [Crocinitomicaceae bacterium]
MIRNLILFFVFSASFLGFGQEDSKYFQVYFEKDSTFRTFYRSHEIFTERWDTLVNPQFWVKVMELPSDSMIVNVARTREIIALGDHKKWDKQTDKFKDAFRDSIRKAKGLDSLERIFVTQGKSDYYQFKHAIPSISKGVELFHQYGVDPWYAQAILLIESPGKIRKSNVGAYGSFQLMKGVARTYGLVVNKYKDERKDFDKSAKAASRLIKEVCIPQAKRILAKYKIVPNETDLWFRLFTMHIYHAGALNVEAVVDEIKPKKGGKELITKMWITQAAGFKNASQNYSQVALASLIKLDRLIMNDCHSIYDCGNDLTTKE